tara:strand:+ start:3313 stop:4857 length:1545 start_codon:yes stop_codon:yes gene_type:complete
MAGAETGARRQKMFQQQKDAKKAAAAAFIEKVIITNNKGKANKRGRRPNRTVDIASGIVNLKYYESLLQDNLVIELAYADSGGAVDNKSALDGLPIERECNVQVKIKDNHGTILDFSNNRKNAFKVENTIPVVDDPTKTGVVIQLVTTEAVKNNYSGVETRGDGKISDQVKSILKDKEFLNSKKKLHIDETANNMNYCFAKKRPFYVINKISKDAVPQGAGDKSGSKLGKSAGFLFWETYKGYYFKGIDTLFGQPPKIKVIYNNDPTPTLPKGYDAKALDYSKAGAPSLTTMLRGGAWNTKITQYNLYDSSFKESSFSAFDWEDNGLTLAGKEFPVLNEEFFNEEKNKNFSRSTFIVDVPGVLPEGTGLGDEQQQLEKSKELTFDSASILNQSIMRYQQMFNSKVTITIAGDFSLHAGDCVWIDTVERTQTTNKECGDKVDKKNGGPYIIATLCHYLTTEETYTKLVLIRDSVGRPASRYVSENESSTTKVSTSGGTEDYHGIKVPKSSGGNFL